MKNLCYKLFLKRDYSLSVCSANTAHWETGFLIYSAYKFNMPVFLVLGVAYLAYPGKKRSKLFALFYQSIFFPLLIISNHRNKVCCAAVCLLTKWLAFDSLLTHSWNKRPSLAYAAVLSTGAACTLAQQIMPQDQMQRCKIYPHVGFSTYLLYTSRSWKLVGYVQSVNQLKQVCID